MLVLAADSTAPAGAAGDILKGVTDFNAKAGLPNASSGLPATVGTIIKSLLGLIGLIFVILIIYAGWLWMSSMGDTKNVDKAKTLIMNSVIGLLIIMASYAIATFIINIISTGVSGGSTTGSI